VASVPNALFCYESARQQFAALDCIVQSPLHSLLVPMTVTTTLDDTKTAKLAGRIQHCAVLVKGRWSWLVVGAMRPFGASRKHMNQRYTRFFLARSRNFGNSCFPSASSRAKCIYYFTNLKKNSEVCMIRFQLRFHQRASRASLPLTLCFPQDSQTGHTIPKPES
jgi:hypothetical protein